MGSDAKLVYRGQAGRTASTSPWPARLDLAQSLSGLLLAGFICVHLLLDSAILISPEAADWVARFFEGEQLLGSAHPWLVSLAAVALFALIVLHAGLALRKFPHDYRQYLAFKQHATQFRHADTRLWGWQVVTGFALFFLAAPHLFTVITQPEQIGALPSSLRVVEERAWILYALFLPVLLIHTAAGVYRLGMKWLPAAPTAAAGFRSRLRWGVGLVTAVYLLLGTAALITYVRHGLAMSGAA
jgi:fumarate reductase subunit C